MNQKPEYCIEVRIADEPDAVGWVEWDTEGEDLPRISHEPVYHHDLTVISQLLLEFCSRGMSENMITRVFEREREQAG